MAYQSKSAFFSKSFFERLTDDKVKRSMVEEPLIQDVVDSIKYNLGNILNARAGHAQSAPELGLMDFNDATITNDDVATQIKQAISHCILRYEPRIDSVNIMLKSDPNMPMNLEVRVIAQIKIDDQKKNVTIDILCDSNRRYQIS